MTTVESPAALEPMPDTPVEERIDSIAAVSHELRAPLHAILGLAELLLDRPLGDSDRDLALAIHREGTALQTIVDDLLDLAKIDAGGLNLVVEPVAPRMLADEVGTMFQPRAEAAGLGFRLVIADDVPLAIRTDRHRLRQVLVNLVSNAVKYTDDGHVTVTMQVAPGTDRLQLLVADTGPGIPDEVIPKLFVPFHQARDDDRIKGTGLGLSIVDRLVRLMGGELFLSSSPHGTTFSVVVPFQPARRASDLDAATVVSNRAAEILIVDDTEVNLLVAKSQVERLGHVATTVESGEQALGLLRSRRFDVVLMDWRMPGLDGIETTRIYLEESAAQGVEPTPVVIVTASVSADARSECNRVGAADFLAKPVSIRDLDTCLRRWLDEDEAIAAGQDTPGDDKPVDATADAIDRAVITQMVDDLGGPEPVAMVIGTFIEDAGQRRDAVMDAGADPRDRGRAAHTLKSTAALLGATVLSQSCASFEAAFGEGTVPADDELARFADQIGHATRELEEIARELNDGSAQ